MSTQINEMFKDGWTKTRTGGGGLKSGGKPSKSQYARAARGHSPAVFKVARNGGCYTKANVRGQLEYLTTKSAKIIDPIGRYEGQQQLTDKQMKQVADRWAKTWDGNSKYGNTTHLIFAFPIGASKEQAEGIVRDICDELFHGGAMDRHDYIAAIHDDRAHVHGHVVVNRKNEEGDTFYLGRDHHYSYQNIREIMVEKAQVYGIHLEATQRWDRGLVNKAPSVDEIYKSKEEGRAPQDRPRVGTDLEFVLSKMKEGQVRFEGIAAEATSNNQVELSKALTMAAIALSKHQPIPTKGNLPMATINDFEKLVDQFNKSVESIENKIETADPAIRPSIEAELDQIYIQASRVESISADMEPWKQPSSTDGIYSQENINSDSLSALKTDEGRAQLEQSLGNTGIRAEELVARLEIGSTTQALERNWMQRDIEAISENKGLDLNIADQREQVLNVYRDTTQNLSEFMVELDIVKNVYAQDNSLSTKYPDGLNAQDVEAIKAGDLSPMSKLEGSERENLEAIKTALQDETVDQKHAIDAVNERLTAIDTQDMDTHRQGGHKHV